VDNSSGEGRQVGSFVLGGSGEIYHTTCICVNYICSDVLYEFIYLLQEGILMYIYYSGFTVWEIDAVDIGVGSSAGSSQTSGSRLRGERERGRECERERERERERETVSSTLTYINTHNYYYNYTYYTVHILLHSGVRG
jgi:hypothetical protein